jgi:hypothetical protein
VAFSDYSQVLVQIQHANPYYDDSYAVNSENVGPYGDAITRELVPYLDKTFRGLGPWARGMYGGSTGGWEALAAQVFYPDDYNGAIANCPDPIDFRAYASVDIYADANAYYTSRPFRRTPRVGARSDDGMTLSTLEQDNLFELVLGTRSRSGERYDIWEATTSSRPHRPAPTSPPGAIDPHDAARFSGARPKNARILYRMSRLSSARRRSRASASRPSFAAASPARRWARIDASPSASSGRAWRICWNAALSRQ